MRYALISDIHGNLEALQAVVDLLVADNISSYIILGDVVGYGSDPEACIEIVRSLGPNVLIAGNHDWGVLGLTDIKNFNEYARSAIEWTKKNISIHAKEYLTSFHLTYKSDDFEVVHGSLDSPSEFNYILSEADAAVTFGLMYAQVCFVGHSHCAGIFCNDSSGIRRIGNKVAMESGSKYVVNVGSVGQPRDGDARAAYAVYDDTQRTVEIKRINYNIEKAAGKIINAGLPRFLAERLKEGR